MEVRGKERAGRFSEIFSCRCRRHFVKDEKLIACERITFLLRLLGYRERGATRKPSRLSKSKNSRSLPVRVQEGLVSEQLPPSLSVAYSVVSLRE